MAGAAVTVERAFDDEADTEGAQAARNGASVRTSCGRRRRLAQFKAGGRAVSKSSGTMESR